MINNKQRKIISFIAVFLFVTGLQAQKVKVANVQRNGNIINVTYKITEAKFNQVFDVSLYVSRDGGNTFTGPLQAVSGGVGKGILAGEHTIAWEVFKDVNSLEGDVVFDVKADVIEQRVYKEFFVSWCGNLDAPLGLMIGTIGKTGWYAAFRTTGLGSVKTNYTYDGDDDWEPGFEQPRYYTFNNTEKTRRFSITAGLTNQMGRDFFIYTGAGYGIRKLLWQIDIYDYDTGNKTDNAYVEQPDYSYSGLELEGGFMVRMNSLLLSLGATTVNFKYSNILVGVGWAF